MVVTLGIREFASNDRHVFLEVVVRSWTNLHRNEVELVLHGRTTAGCLHGDSCVGTPRVASYPGPHAERGRGPGDTWQNSRMC